MRAFLKKDRKWHEVDTKCLFTDQYNLVDVEERVFDRNIERIEDDVRGNLGKCKYCGKIVERGHEEEHFEEEESKQCSGCWWFRDSLISETRKPTTDEQETLKDGSIRTVYKTEVIRKFVKVCKFDGCANDEHRKYGITWFTPENTFFLKYPNGVPRLPVFSNATEEEITAALEMLDFVKTYGGFDYKHKIGSYYLCLRIVPGFGTVMIPKFELYNSRKRINFTYNGNVFFVDTWSSHEERKGLDVPADVNEALKKILEKVVSA